MRQAGAVFCLCLLMLSLFEVSTAGLAKIHASHGARHRHHAIHKLETKEDENANKGKTTEEAATTTKGKEQDQADDFGSFSSDDSSTNPEQGQQQKKAETQTEASVADDMDSQAWEATATVQTPTTKTEPATVEKAETTTELAPKQDSHVDVSLTKMSDKDHDDLSDDEEDLRIKTYEDFTNLYHSHDAAPAVGGASFGVPPPLPNPYMYGPVSSMLAMQRAEQCLPSLFRVDEQAHAGGSASFRWTSLTAEDVKKHLINTMPLTQFAKLPDTPFSNVDGRVNHPILGAMGGDAGEFLLALNAFEKVSDKQLTSFQVAAFFSDFLISSPKSSFSLQTDTAALDVICRKLKFCLPQYRLDRPPISMIPLLQSELIKPEFIGCAHLKHLVQQPDKFLIRKELVTDFISAFYNLLWGVPANAVAPRTLAFIQSKLRLQILQGPHTEGGLLRVNTQACSEQFIPMLVPEQGGVSIAIQHEDAVQILRKHMASFLAEQSKKFGLANTDTTDEDELVEKMDSVADTQFMVALAIDNGRIPVFSLTYPGACCMGHLKGQNQANFNPSTLS